MCSTGPFASSLPWDSIPTPKPMSGLRRAALASERGHHGKRNQVFSSYCESMCPKQSGTVITRPQLRSLPPRPTAPNVTSVERVLRVLPRSSFTSSTTWAIHGSEKRGERFTRLHPQLSIDCPLTLHSRGRIICNIKRNDVFIFLGKKTISYHTNDRDENTSKNLIVFVFNGQPNYYILKTEL